jgi:GMP synthase (glutamine-hydrolysing)
VISKAKQVLILQHIALNPPGRVSLILDEYEIPYHVILITTNNEPLPDPSAYQAILALGGTHYTEEEITFVYQAISQGVPYLGICLGGELLARALGASVERLPKRQIGFLDIQFTEAGRQDPLYQGHPGQQAFQWHEDGFLLPHGAVELACHEDGSNQAFRYTQRAYGLQYHLEPTEEMLDEWLHTPSWKQVIIDTYGIDAYHRIERDAVELFPAYAQHASSVLKNFLSLSALL